MRNMGFVLSLFACVFVFAVDAIAQGSKSMVIAPDNVFSDHDVNTLETLAEAFTAYKINTGGNVVREIIQGMTYAHNPVCWSVAEISKYKYTGSGPSGNGPSSIIYIYDEDMVQLNTKTATDWKNYIKYCAWQGVPDTPYMGLNVQFSFSGNSVTFRSMYAADLTVTFGKTPKYIKITDDWTVGKYTTEVPDYKKHITYNENEAEGLFEQIGNMISGNMIATYNAVERGIKTSEYGRFMDAQMVHTVNDMRHAIRLASYNIYGAVRTTLNWQAVKEFLQGKGIDIVGFQEVKDINGVVAETFPAALSSWDLSQFATTQQNYGTAVGANGKFTVVSTSEHDYVTHGREIRRYTKTELYLPMYKHRWWSDHLKISVYCTQWELNKTTAVAQATELAEAMAADKNPFIVMMADTNDDFSFDRETWKVMEDAGFRPLFDLQSATLAVGRDPIDNIFVNDRIKLIESNVVDCSEVRFIDAGGNTPIISDHDLIYADVQLDYDNIVCVKAVGTNCTVTSDNGHPEWFERDSGIVTYTITPDEGYTVTSKVVYDIIDCTSSKYPTGIVTINGNTITVDTSRVYGDMAIKATAK